MTSHRDPLTVHGWAADAMRAQDVIQELGECADKEVTVNIAGILVDVNRVSYDTDRDKCVLDLHPDDVDDVLRRLFWRTPTRPNSSAHQSAWAPGRRASP